MTMRYTEIGDMVDRVWALKFKPGSARWLQEAKRIVGECNPLGDNNRKTDAPGTYRPVGDSCPQTCPYLDGRCYALHGPVGMTQRRSSADVGPSLGAAIIAMVWAAKTRRKARLHISGGFCAPGGGVQWRYVYGLAIVAREVRSRSWRPNNGWTYCHVEGADGEMIRDILGNAGISVRLSDQIRPGGAVVCAFEHVDLLKVNGIRTLKCPAQLPQEATCTECAACWEQPDHTVVFKPHGAVERRTRENALRVLNIGSR